MARFSEEVMVAMGFRSFAEGEVLAASFVSVIVYEARGVTLAPGTTQVAVGAVTDVNYKLAVSSSVNDASMALTEDTFVDNEEEWKKENKCLGPFVLVQFGPTREHSCNSGYIKVENDGSKTTYDRFSIARVELAQLEAAALPAVVSALTCAFNEETKYGALRKITRAIVGRSSESLVIHDIRIDVRAEGYVSHQVPAEVLIEKLSQPTRLASTLNPKAARFFALGSGEDDQLKRFLYFFLALEVETHAAFRRLDHKISTQRLLDQAASAHPSTVLLMQTQTQNLRNLYDRFVWCATCMWINILEADVAQFKNLKQARDDIAHGSSSEPPHGYARLAEILAHKVLWATR